MPTSEGREQLQHPSCTANTPARCPDQGSPQSPTTTSTQVPGHGCPRKDLAAGTTLPAPVQRPPGQEEEAVPPTMPGSTLWHPASPLPAGAPAGAARSASCNLMPSCVSTAGPPVPLWGTAKHVPPTPGPTGTPGSWGALSPQGCTLMWGVSPHHRGPRSHKSNGNGSSWGFGRWCGVGCTPQCSPTHRGSNGPIRLCCPALGCGGLGHLNSALALVTPKKGEGITQGRGHPGTALGRADPASHHQNNRERAGYSPPRGKNLGRLSGPAETVHPTDLEREGRGKREISPGPAPPPPRPSRQCPG